MDAYSVNFSVKGDADLYAADWNWQDKSRWACSVKEAGAQAWVKLDKLTETAYQALLQHFGLEIWRRQFTLPKIIRMSPTELAEARRRKERLYGLRPQNMISQTMGSHRPAECYK